MRSIIDHAPFSLALEVGCSEGWQLLKLAKLLPETKFIGVDRDLKSLGVLENKIDLDKIENVLVHPSDVDQLSEFKSKSVDIVFSSACLLYVDSLAIKDVLANMCRIARKAVILLEQHKAGADTTSEHTYIKCGLGRGYWLHDYEKIASKVEHVTDIRLKPVRHPVWVHEQWEQFASIIEIYPAG